MPPATMDRTDNMSAAARWIAAVAKQMERGLPRAKAVAHVAAENPDLHVAYLAEFNGRSQSADRPADSQAISDWTALVDSNVARGMSRTKAVNAGAIQNPELHAAYLKAYNAQAQERRR